MLEDLIKKFSIYKEIEDQTKKESFNQVSLYIHYILSKKENNPDLYLLAKILDDKNYNKLIDYYDGISINIPTKKEKEYADLISTCFYMKEILGYEWTKIKKILKENKIEIDQYSLGRKISDIKQQLRDDIERNLHNIDEEQINEVLKNG